MTENQWTEFVKIREDFKQRVKNWNDALKTESIAALQKELADADGVPEYPLENAVIENTFPIGVSNEFTDKSAKIAVKNGTLLIVSQSRI